MYFFLKNLFIICLLCIAVTAHSQIPRLSSYPTAAATIFLDFDGHTVEGTGWNYGGPIYAQPSGLSNASITQIFDRVAEDYRPFNINITTDSTAFLNAPITQRMRVIITTTSSWYGSGAGGVAFVGSFSWGDDTPCFIFNALLSNNVKKVSEAAAHEAGHTLGLYHQASYNSSCGLVSSYNTGIGSGEIGWAPIMGVGYSKNFTIWHNGPNSYGCDQLQDDLSIITGSKNGFGYRPDDHGKTIDLASNMAFVSNEFTASGVIEQTTDQDLFKFVLPKPGHFSLDAVPYNVGANNAGSDLDMQVTLFNATQTELGRYNPGTLLNSIIDSTLSAGTYYLMVEGKGNAYASDYGSLGSYALQASFQEITPLPLHELKLSGSIINNEHHLTWIIDADEAVTDIQLEVSQNRADFVSLAQPATDARSWDVHTPSGGSYYRLKVGFDNGKSYYSSTLYLRGTSNTEFPKILNNPVTGRQLQLSGTVSGRYEILQSGGQVCNAGSIKPGVNTLSLQLPSGMYFIRFINEKGAIKTDRFILQ